MFTLAVIRAVFAHACVTVTISPHASFDAPQAHISVNASLVQSVFASDFAERAMEVLGDAFSEFPPKQITQHKGGFSFTLTALPRQLNVAQSELQGWVSTQLQQLTTAA